MTQEENGKHADMLDAMCAKLSTIIRDFAAGAPPNMPLAMKEKTLADMHVQLAAMQAGSAALRGSSGNTVS